MPHKCFQVTLRRATASALISLWIYSGGCSSSASNENSGPIDIADVVYLSGTNDEGLLLLLGSKPVQRPSSTPVILSPTEGSTPVGPTSISYSIGATSTRPSPPRTRSPAARCLERLFGPEGSAHAHGAPMNGPAFLLTFSSASNPHLLRVFTQEVTYDPTDVAWQQLVSAGGKITLAVTLAIFDEGHLVENGGPFISAPVHFTPA